LGPDNVAISSVLTTPFPNPLSLTVFNVTGVMARPTGIDGFEEAVATSFDAPTGLLYVFAAPLDSLAGLPANQGPWTSLGSFAPGVSSWDVQLDTSSLASNVAYLLAFTTESDPSLLFPDDPANPTPMGFCVLDNCVPESSSVALFGTGTLGLLGFGWRRRKLAA
jgi:hypothetical protein